MRKPSGASKGKKDYNSETGVATAIRRLIAEQQEGFKAGQRLDPPNKLSKILKASASTIRKARSRLQDEGLLEPVSGARVTRNAPLMARASEGRRGRRPGVPKDEHIIDFVRLLLGAAAFGAARDVRLRRSPLKEMNEFKAAFLGLSQAYKRGRGNEGRCIGLAEDRRFHAAVFDLAPNGALHLTLHLGRGYMLDQLCVHLQVLWVDVRLVEELFALNKSLYECVMRGDAEGALAASHAYMLCVEREYWEVKRGYGTSGI